MTDLRLAFRSLARAPGLSVAVILTLGLGIGSVSTMFSITRGILRDLPVERPGDLVQVAEVDRRTTDDGYRLQAWELLERRAQQTTTHGARRLRKRHLSRGRCGPGRAPDHRRIRHPECVRCPAYSRPARGRDFTRTGRASGRPRHRDARLLGLARPVRVWIPASWAGAFASMGRRAPSSASCPTDFASRARPICGFRSRQVRAPRPVRATSWTVLGRLRDGRPLDDARTEFAAIGARLSRAEPATHEFLTLHGAPLSG